MWVFVVQDDVAGCFEYYADLAEGLDAKQNVPVSLPMETFKSYVLKEPIGVVALITPWYLLLFVKFFFIFASFLFCFLVHICCKIYCVSDVECL